MNWQPATAEDVDILEDWWVKKSRVNFLAYREFMRSGNFESNWFIEDLCKQLQQFYLDLKAGLRPVLLIQSPPQHGKSWSITDFLAWISGKIPELRAIYATYSDTLGTRCNLAMQRQLDSSKYSKIFPKTKISNKRGEAVRTTNHLEYIDKEGNPTNGQFRNTTVAGSVTGESLDIGVIDDAVKGREQANSITWSQKIWEWFTDDFSTRFSEKAGLLIIMTRWSTHDIIGRLLDIKKKFSNCKFTRINYEAVATKDSINRRVGEALFPQLKSLEFLKNKKSLMAGSSWESLYQGAPTIAGGNIFKDDWWGWWKKVLPKFKYKFITADTALKAKTKNDWSVLQAWGFGYDGRINLIDKKRGKWESPELETEAEIFYNKHNTPRLQVDDPILRAMYIEDKASGIGLLQRFRRKNMKVIAVPRHIDKVFRAEDAAPFIKSGLVVLNTEIEDIGNLTKEGREFPNGTFDDDIDTLMTAVEVTYINKMPGNSLQAAMEADN